VDRGSVLDRTAQLPTTPAAMEAMEAVEPAAVAVQVAEDIPIRATLIQMGHQNFRSSGVFDQSVVAILCRYWSRHRCAITTILVTTDYR
jgi:hypothetical protein